VGVEQAAIAVEQHLILMAGFKDRARLRFAGFELRGALPNAPLQRLVELPQLDLGFLGGRDVVGDADEADMLAVRVPARLRLRAQPAPIARGIPIARLEHEWLE